MTMTLTMLEAALGCFAKYMDNMSAVGRERTRGESARKIAVRLPKQVSVIRLICRLLSPRIICR